MIYYKHYMGDYQRHTGHLTLVQDGAYRRMMDHYYSTEQPLPASRDALYRICGAFDKLERAAVDFIADTFFCESGGKLHHQRVDEEISIAQEKIANLKANARNGGKQSGAVRSSKNEANASLDGEANAQAKTNNKSVVNSHTKPKGLEKQKTLADITLPDWIPLPLWEDWITYRKSIKAPLTHRAAELCISKLFALSSDGGGSPTDIIEQSIMSGKWTGLFPIKNQVRQVKFDPTEAVNRNRKRP